MDVGVEAAGGEDLALAGDHFGAGADDDRHAGLDVGIAGLADRMDEPVPDADVGLDDPPMVEDDGVGDDGVDRAARARHLALAHAVADHLAAAELHLFAIDGEVLLDLDEEFGVGEPHPVARGRAEHVGVGGAGKRGGAFGHGSLWIALPAERWPKPGESAVGRMRRAPRQTPVSREGSGERGAPDQTFPITSLRKPIAWRLPASATRRTSRFWPGSKRIAVPAAMSRRKPRASARSNFSAGLVSKK